MNKRKLEYFRKALQKRYADLSDDMQSTVSQITHDDEVYADWTDTASAETSKTLQLRIRDRERMLMGKILEAIDRIEAGTFGLCENCGEQIAEKRLKARPVTTLCIECKSEMESGEHRYQYA